MNFRKNKFGGGTALVLAAIFIAACTTQGPAVQLQGDLASVKRIAVLPFQDMAALHGLNKSVVSPISGRTYITGPVADGADLLLNKLLITHLRRDTTFQIVSSRNAAAIMDDSTRNQGQNRDQRRLLAQTGQRLGVDAVMVGQVYRFRKRVGQAMAAESPASVAFDIYLIDCRQGHLLWNAFYNYTQQALSDNLGDIRNFMRYGGRWATAEELATTAMDDIFKDFPQPS